MLDILVPEILLDGPCIVTVIREFVTGGMPEHVWMDWEIEASQFPKIRHFSRTNLSRKTVYFGKVT